MDFKGYDLGTACIVCGTDINDMLERSSEFYTLKCDCGHTGEVCCVSCIESGIPIDKARTCTKCGSKTTTAQRMRTG